MEIQLSANIEAKIRVREGRESGAIAAEALKNYVDYDAWYLARVDEAVLDFETGNDFSHSEVVAEVEELLNQHRTMVS